MSQEEFQGKNKKKNRNIFLAGGFLTAAATIGLLFFYQGDYGTESIRSEGKTTITVTFASGDDSWNKAVSLACDAFTKKYPEIEIEMQPSSRSQSGFYNDYLKRQIAVGELGDVVEIKDIQMAYGEGLFQPLPDKLTKLFEDVWTASDGFVYTLPEVGLEQGIIYNKGIFEALNLPLPETWREFEDLCEILKEKQYTPLVIGGGDSWHLQFWSRYFFNSCVTSSNPSWQEDCTLGKVHWTDDEPAKMLDRFVGLFEKGYVNDGYSVTGDAETCEYIANGSAVMLYSLCNQLPKIKNMNPEIELGWFFMPDDEGRKYSYTDNQSGWGISTECGKDEKKYEAAVKFLELFYSEEIYGEICGIMNAIPVTKQEIRIKDEQLQEIQAQAKSGVLKPKEQIGDEDTPEGFRNFLYEGISEAAKGEKTRKQVLEEFQEMWERMEVKEE